MAPAAGVHWAVAVEPVAATRGTAVQPARGTALSVKDTVPVGVAPEPLVGSTVAV